MRKLPVLTLHSIDDSGSVVSLSRRALEAMLRPLAEAGCEGRAVGTALQCFHESPADDGRHFAIAFDDGYANLRSAALPVLRGFGFTATVFVVAGRCGQDSRWPGQPHWVPALPLLDWPDLEALLQEGWEVGSHGLTHQRLTDLVADDVEREMALSRDALAARLQISVSHFAYPYGAHDRTVREIAGRHYDVAFGTRLAVATERELRRRLAVSRVDAYYLRRFPAAAAMYTARGAAYLALRRLGRSLRSAVTTVG